MIDPQPVLVSIKSNWESIAEYPVVGKDVLELLSSSMYINPLSIYREYVQNASDAIEEATALGLLARIEDGRITFDTDVEERAVRIRDNGTGISRNEFEKRLVALGASRKRGSKARGFRGVGRLGGLGYCQELIFRSKADDERVISEMRWDCRRLRAIMRDAAFKGDLESLIKDVVRVQRFPAPEAEGHFFEVELSGVVRHGDDRLMNATAIAKYLSQVAPVPFSPDFSFGKNIDDTMRCKVPFATFHIHVDGSPEPLFRPHRDEFEARRGVQDLFKEVRFYNIEGNDGSVAATGWILQHGYLGAIDSTALVRGIRLRSGNMQVGEEDILDEVFPEPRFNSWVVGEFNILDDRILPNGRRDHFEPNIHFNNLLSALRPIAHDLSRQCRQSSVHRNLVRQAESVIASISNSLGIIAQGTIGQHDRKKFGQEVVRLLDRLETLASHASLLPLEKRRLAAKLKALKRLADKSIRHKSNREFTAMSAHDKALLTRFCSLLYEYSGNKQATKILLDRVLAKL